MRCEIEAGTDAGLLLLFDPGAMPADFDRRTQADPAVVLERLKREGRAFGIDTGGDGSFLLHVHVDEPLPGSLAPFAREIETSDSLQIPSGRLYLTGVECAYRDDDSLLRKYPHMGGSATVPAGTYRLTVYRASYPKNLVEARFLAEASPWEYRLWGSMRPLIPLAVAAWISLVVIFFTQVRVRFPNFVAPILVFIFALPFLVRRHNLFRTARERYARLEREYPMFLVRLERYLTFLDEGPGPSPAASAESES